MILVASLSLRPFASRSPLKTVDSPLSNKVLVSPTPVLLREFRSDMLKALHSGPRSMIFDFKTRPQSPHTSSPESKSCINLKPPQVEQLFSKM
jgi:hypothetical protein